MSEDKQRPDYAKGHSPLKAVPMKCYAFTLPDPRGPMYLHITGENGIHVYFSVDDEERVSKMIRELWERRSRMLRRSA